MVEQTKKRAKSQIENFRQTARDLEADDSEQHFNERLGKIARQKPASPAKKSKKATRA